MKIIVSRSPGDKKGSSIVDPLLVSDIVGIARAKREIDFYTSKQVERGNCPLHGYIQPGKVANLVMKNARYKGKVTLYTVTIDIDSNYFLPTSSINIERKME